MIPYAVQCGDITAKDLEILGGVRTYVEGLCNGADCHTVCSLIERYVFPNEVSRQTGYFASKGWDHSWLVVRGRPVIIDPYPWCCGSGPILVYTGGTINPWRDLYISVRAEGPGRTP